jgi:hypothetical protein
LAFFGAVVVQFGWPVVLNPRGSAGRPSAAALLVLATAYLLVSAWSIWQGTLRNGSASQLGWPRRIGLFCDGMLSGTVLAIMTRGHQGGVLGLGLWMAPPVLFTFSALSACLAFFNWGKGSVGSATAAAGPLGLPGGIFYVRTAIAILLLVVLIAVEVGGQARATFR